jgi:hypothetical protein
LSGIREKGVLVAEKLSKNKAAFLDLMALLVSRMNNDVQRLSKICGSSLSTTARTLVEEHIKKVEMDGGLISPAKVLGSSCRSDDSSVNGRTEAPRSTKSHIPES